jgi:hypothetical protein
MRPVKLPVRDTRSVRPRARDRRREPAVGIDGPIVDHERPRAEPSETPKSDRGIAVVDFYI